MTWSFGSSLNVIVSFLGFFLSKKKKSGPTFVLLLSDKDRLSSFFSLPKRDYTNEQCFSMKEGKRKRKKRKKVNWNIKTRTGPSSRFLAKGEHRNFLSPFTLMARVMTFIVLSKSQDVSKDSMRIDGTRKRITLNWGRKIYVFVTFLTRGETRWRILMFLYIYVYMKYNIII